MADLDWADMPKHIAIKNDWKTNEILIEGSLNCGKTTLGLDKEIDALLKWPGIPILLFRWSEDAVETKLRPAFQELLRIRGLTAHWDAKPKRFVFPNGSMAYLFGLKSVSIIEQYNKIRGLGVSRIFGDQIEEMAPQVAGELRGRLRPDLTATLSGRRFPFQLTFVANPEDYDFWLSKEFPEDNHVKGRRLYSLSVMDNKHLPRESVESLLRQYPPEHPKHLTMVLGRRGPNIIGVPVFEGLYDKALHHVPVEPLARMPFLESFEVGKHNPCWVMAQQTYTGGLHAIGGVRAQEMALEDFLPIVKELRAAWTWPGAKIRTCTSPMGDKEAAISVRYTAMALLREAGFRPTYWDTGNAADVRLALIESIAGYLRRRGPNGVESFAVNNDPAKWLSVSRDDVKEMAFMHIALEAGYVWDKHFVSVSNKEVRQPIEDDKFANAMHCLENIVLNFCAGQMSQQARDRRVSTGRQKARTSQEAGGAWGKAPWMV